MLKFFGKILLTLVGLILVVILFLAMMLVVLKPHFDEEVQKLIHLTKNRNVEINFLDYGKIHLSRAGLELTDIRVRGVTRINHPYFDPREFELSVKQVQFGFQEIDGNGLRVDLQIEGMNAKGGRMLKEDPDDHERLESVSQLDLQTKLTLKGTPFSWKNQILKRAEEFKAWAFNNAEIRDLKLKGIAVFVVDDWPVKVNFQSTEDAKGYVNLEGRSEDLRVIAEMIEPKFTETDLHLAAKNLLKAPRLLQIRTAAEMQAIRLKNRDKDVPYWVARHVYWSYWLTKAYGAEFAKEATDAHEIGDDLESEEMHQIGRIHNALGREYAVRNLSEAEVEKMIFSDTRVVRASSMKNFSETMKTYQASLSKPPKHSQSRRVS